MNTNMVLPRRPSGPRRKRDWLDRLASGKVCFFCLLATAVAFGFGLLLVLRRYPALLRGVLDLELSRVVSFFMPAAGLALITTIVLGLAVINALRGPLVVVGRTLADWLRKIVAAIGWSLQNFLVRPLVFLWNFLVKPVLNLAQKVLPLLVIGLLILGGVAALVYAAIQMWKFISGNWITLLGIGVAIWATVLSGVIAGVIVGVIVITLIKLTRVIGRALVYLLKKALSLIQWALTSLFRPLQSLWAILINLYGQLTARHLLLFAFLGALISGGGGVAMARRRYSGWLLGDPSLDKVIPFFIPAIVFAVLTLLLSAYVWRDPLRRGLIGLGQTVGKLIGLAVRVVVFVLKNLVGRPLAFLFWLLGKALKSIGQFVKWSVLSGLAVGLLLVKFLWRVGQGLLRLLGLVLRALWFGIRILIIRPLVLVGRAVVYLLKKALHLIRWTLTSLFELLQSLWAILINLYGQLTARHLLLFAFVGTFISGGGGLVLSLQVYPDWPKGDPTFDKVLPFFIPAIGFAALTLLLSVYVWRDLLRRGLIGLGQAVGKLISLAVRVVVFVLKNFVSRPLAFLWKFVFKPMLNLAQKVLPWLVMGLLILGGVATLVYVAIQMWKFISGNLTTLLSLGVLILAIMLSVVTGIALIKLLVIIGRALVTLVIKPSAIAGRAVINLVGHAATDLIIKWLTALGRWLVRLVRNAATTARLHPRAVMTLALPVVLLSSGLGWLWTDGTLCLWGFQWACQPSPPPPPPLCAPAAPSSALEICIVTSGTKADWVRDTAKTFNAAQFKTASGKPISVTVAEADSGDFLPRLREGRIVSPTVWSPGEISWVNEANVYWQERYGKPLVIGPRCSPTVYAIIGIGMWKPMAEAMGWPNEPISWDQLVELTADPQGWARYGHPEWGQFKFGHTHPGYSNTGFLAMASLVYNTLDRTDGLTPEMVKSPAVVEAYRQLELHTDRYGTSTRSLFTFMATKGPDFLHAGTNSESGVFATNKFNQDQMRFPLVFIIPADGAFWSENPYCVIDGEWVSAEQREAAQIYEDYLLAREQQDRAMDFGLRPTDPSVPLRAPMTADWTDVRATPKTALRLESVSGEASAAIKDVFQQTKKKATIAVVLDTSGSMQGEKMTNAVEASANFLKRLNKDDEVVVFAFGDTVTELQPSGRAGDVVEALAETLRALPAQGRTALYDAVCTATDRLAQLKTAHEAKGEQRLYGLVILSDGQDTASRKSQDFLYICLPKGEKVGDAKVFTIAYGVDADKTLLEDIARRTNGQAFSGDPATIEQVYLAISAEQ